MSIKLTTKKAKTFNSQIYTLICNRLKLKRREKIVFFRLLGFLIRNDKPFPYSVGKLAEITGYSKRSIFESFNALENLRLIERIGYTSRVKYAKGRIMIKACTLVQKRINNDLIKNSTLVQKPHKLPSASAETAYQKTTKTEPKEGGSLLVPDMQDYKWYLANPKYKMPDRLIYVGTTEEWISMMEATIL